MGRGGETMSENLGLWAAACGGRQPGPASGQARAASGLPCTCPLAPGCVCCSTRLLSTPSRLTVLPACFSCAPRRPADAAVDQEAGVDQFVMTSIQRVFGNNFKGDDTEPKAWVSSGEKMC